jgi:hypothetical protein
VRPPAPKRKQATSWKDFIRAHMAALVATDLSLANCNFDSHRACNNVASRRRIYSFQRGFQWAKSIRGEPVESCKLPYFDSFEFLTTRAKWLQSVVIGRGILRNHRRINSEPQVNRGLLAFRLTLNTLDFSLPSLIADPHNHGCPRQSSLRFRHV